MRIAQIPLIVICAGSLSDTITTWLIFDVLRISHTFEAGPIALMLMNMIGDSWVFAHPFIEFGIFYGAYRMIRYSASAFPPIQQRITTVAFAVIVAVLCYQGTVNNLCLIFFGFPLPPIPVSI